VGIDGALDLGIGDPAIPSALSAKGLGVMGELAVEMTDRFAVNGGLGRLSSIGNTLDTLAREGGGGGGDRFRFTRLDMLDSAPILGRLEVSNE
jgi:hypothetical protein